MRYFDKGESESSDALGPGEIQCDFSTHPFPHRKFTTILYLSDTIGLTDEQLDMANFRDSLHVQDISHRRLEEDAEEEDERRHVSGSIVEEENGHRNLGSTPQSYKYRKALDTLTATQRDFVEGNEYASVGGGLCFPKWTEDRGADVDVLDPEQALVSSIAECRRSPPQSKTGCCDKLLQTRCGDLVAFSSGGENPHAVMPVLTGKRLNIQTWWAPRKSPPFANCGMQKIAIAEEISETCKTKNQDVFDSAFVLGMGEPVRIYEVSCKTYSNGNRRCRHASAPFDDTRRVCTSSSTECIVLCKKTDGCVAASRATVSTLPCTRGKGETENGDSDEVGRRECVLHLVTKKYLENWGIGLLSSTGNFAYSTLQPYEYAPR